MTEKDFTDEIEQAFRAAWHSGKGGDQGWDSLLFSYGAQPLTPEEKNSLAENSEIKIARGAYPIELRRVYEKIMQKYSSDPQVSGAVKSFDMDAKVKDYYQKIKPFGGMSDIFKNAAAGSLTKYSAGMKGEKHYTIRCKNCAAPRLEEDQYDECLFCGSKLFEPIKQ